MYTNEIPSELSGENLISLHVKTSLLLRLHNKSHLSHQKTIEIKWFVFYWCLYKIEHYMVAWRYEISLLVLTKIFHE